MQTHYDVVVIGLGAVGAASLYALSKHPGIRVLGLEQQPTSPHTDGSSHGQTRLLRVAYQEGGHYVPLVRRAIKLWRELETETGSTLFQQSGVFYAAPEDMPLIQGSRSAAKEHNVAVDEATVHFPHGEYFDIPADWTCLFEPEGGYLYIEEAISAMLNQARKNGAETLFNSVASVDQNGSKLRISWEDRAVTADKVVLSYGPWAIEHLPFLKPHLSLERRTLHWFEDPSGVFAEGGAFRPFALQPDMNTWFYGFPGLDGTVKAAIHGDLPEPSKLKQHAEINYCMTPEDREETERLVRRHLPMLGKSVRDAVCTYTMNNTGKGSFVMDQHPDLPGAYFTAGLSGHGFKFASALGEIMAELTVSGHTGHDISAFSLEQFG